MGEKFLIPEEDFSGSIYVYDYDQFVGIQNRTDKITLKKSNILKLIKVLIGILIKDDM
jgi:hypothetical protein